MKQETINLTSGRVLARSSIWNLLGQLLPMIVAALALPLLIHGLGMERFGVLSLAWVVSGYFSLFDFGVGRALTKLVADKIGANEGQAIPGVVWTSLLLMFALGTAGGLLAAAISPWLVHKALKISSGLQTETLRAFYLLALSIPLITVTSGLRGVLEAQQRFRILTLIRLPMGILSIAGPLLILPFSKSLALVISALLVTRLMGFMAHLLACLKAIPALRQNLSLRPAIAVSVLKFGGWMTISNLISPMMVYMDRFLIGSLLSLGSVAYYTAPLDMVTRLLVVPAGIAGVLFPALALSLAQESPRTALLLGRGEKYVFLAVFPAVLLIVSLAPEGLRLWLGNSFAQNGATALRWLAAGVFLNSLAQIPFVLIQSAGRPDITAKVNLCELPVYVIVVWVLTMRLGIEGTAIAWTGRNALDALMMFFFAQRVMQRGSKALMRIAAATVGGLLLLFCSALFGSLAVRSVILALGLIMFGLITWFHALDDGEKIFLFPPKRTISVQPEAVSSETPSFGV